MVRLSVDVIAPEVGRDLGLGAVSVLKELLLVVEELFARLSRELGVLSLDDGVDGAGLLA